MAGGKPTVDLWNGDSSFSTSSLSLQHSECGPAILEFLMCPLKLKSSFYSTTSDKTGNWENCCIHGGGCHRRVHKARGSCGNSRRDCHTTGSNAPYSWTGDDFLLVWKPPIMSPAVIHIVMALKHHFSLKSHGPSLPIWLPLSFLTLSFSLDCY